MHFHEGGRVLAAMGCIEEAYQTTFKLIFVDVEYML